MLQTTSIMCPVCRHVGSLGSGPAGRPRASCGGCGSLERHRALVGILPGLREAASSGALLDVAPSAQTSQRLKELAVDAGVRYLGMDFDPSADDRTVTVQASLTDLPLADASAGLIVCFHVLEHIPDDLAAMREIRRSLAPGGVAVIQVPHRPDQPTDEDPSAPLEERLRRFGQADHVRYYGADLEDRLVSAGLTVRHVVMADLYGPLETDLLGILPEEPLWLCTAGAVIDVPALAERCMESARAAAVASLDVVVRQREESEQDVRGARQGVVDLKARLKRAERERDRALARERHLRSRPDVRVMSAIARRLKIRRPKS